MMHIIGEPPARLGKALAVIGDALHPSFDLRSRIVPGKSKESCVLCALTVRDFLREIGFADARVAPVICVIWALQDGKQLHSLGMGAPDNPKARGPHHWRGHLVTVAADWLIDCTLYPSARPAWPDLPGMIAVPLFAPAARTRPLPMYDLDAIASIGGQDPENPGYEFAIAWLDNPKNRGWRRGPDARDSVRRAPVIRHMLARFNGEAEAA